MTSLDEKLLTVKPIISYPHVAEIGKTYLLSIDLQPLLAAEEDWPLKGEECIIYCMLSTAPLFSNHALGEPAVIVHRYGGSYGPATFLLTAAEEEMVGTIRVTLVNGWGVPLIELPLRDIHITRQQITTTPDFILPSPRVVTAPDSLPPFPELSNVDWLAGIVRIVNAGNHGTGFVVSADGLIVTCAHVLGESTPENADVVFQATGEKRMAKIIPEWWRSTDAEDVALLRVTGDLPEGVHPLPLGSSQGTEGHPLVTFGYPGMDEVEGIRGTGTILGLGARTIAGQPLLQLRSSEITAGFSGAPVWDEMRRRVIGMVVIAAESDADKLGETAFATPAETLCVVCPVLQVSDICPYRNLEAFTEADAMFFFGRERIINQLVSSLQHESRFLVVLGPSGSGKSSVVQAGLIPQLREGALPESHLWQLIVTRPFDDPFKQLAAQGLVNASNDLSESIRAWLAVDPQHTRLVLILDQFEELFVVCPESLRQDFLTQLTKLIVGYLPVTVILVMRDDFYGRLTQHEKLMKLLTRGIVNVPAALTREELMDIVRKPAEYVGIQFEEGLIDVIVRDALEATSKGSREGVSRTILPSLEFTLTQLWELQRDVLLTFEAYNRIGGIAGALTPMTDHDTPVQHIDVPSAILQQVHSPYIFTPPVKGKALVDREEIFARITSLWTSQDQRAPLLIHGHRRMGKTSISQDLVSRCDLGDDTQLVYLSLEGQSLHNEGDLYQLLASRIWFRFKSKQDKPDIEDFTGDNARTNFDLFLALFNEIVSSTRLVLVLDEFEMLYSRLGAVKANDVVAYLQAQMVTYTWMTLALVGVNDLDDIHLSYGTSILGWVGIRVSFLDEVSVINILVNAPQDPDFPLDYTPEALQTIATLTNGQPFLVQVIGDRLVQRYNRMVFTEQREHSGVFDVDDVRAVLEDPIFYNTAAAYFQGVWGQATRGQPGEIVLLKALAAYEDGLEEIALRKAVSLDYTIFTQALETLERHDVLSSKDNRISYTLPLMRRWVQDTSL